MKAEELLKELRRKFQVPNNRVLAERLGISEPLLSQWSGKESDMTPKQVANLVTKAKKRGKKDAHHYSIKPVVEYYPIQAVESGQGAAWELFDPNGSNNKREKKIKEKLSESFGVYVFYDSRGVALYVGKAKNRDLWNEMKDAFNRDRDTQKIRKVAHPTTGSGFRPAYDAPRNITSMHTQLNQLAYYFSAYEVEREMINNVEALLVRTFANTLLNAKMEKFTKFV